MIINHAVARCDASAAIAPLYLGETAERTPVRRRVSETNKQQSRADPLPYTRTVPLYKPLHESCPLRPDN